MSTTRLSTDGLTLSELVQALPSLLARDYAGARSGRVRDLPDVRTVRWYQTLGMVDRPAAFRGRTALFGRRHLLQLAAIKKLQAAGFPLADIQRGLAGKNDAELARSAGVAPKDADLVIERAVLARSQATASQLAAAVAGRTVAPSRRASAFWKARPEIAASRPPAPAPPSTMQSVSLGGSGMLLWNGRELTASELASLTKLASPLIAFLQSVQSSAAGASAEGASRPASSPRRPEEGTRR